MAGRLWRKNLDEGWGEPSRSFRRLVAADAEQICALLFSVRLFAKCEFIAGDIID